MYPESLKYDFNNDRSEVFQWLSNMNSDNTNLRATFLVCYWLYEL